MLLTGSWQASLGAFCMHFDGIVQHVRTKKVQSLINSDQFGSFFVFFVVSILNLSVFCWSHSLCSPFLQTESWGTKPCLWRWRLWAEKSCEVQNGAERMLGDVGRCLTCSWFFGNSSSLGSCSEFFKHKAFLPDQEKYWPKRSKRSGCYDLLFY